MTRSESIRNQKVLLVDDNRQLLRAIRLKLELDGFEVVASESGDDAVTKLEAGLNPDILLTDAVMPGDTQGPDLAHYTKTRHPDVPVVLMSGYLGAGDVQISESSVIDRFISKPLVLSDLSAQLSRLLGRQYADELTVVG